MHYTMYYFNVPKKNRLEIQLCIATSNFVIPWEQNTKQIDFFYRAPEHKTYQEMRNTVRAESNYKFWHISTYND